MNWFLIPVLMMNKLLRLIAVFVANVEDSIKIQKTGFSVITV